MPPRTHSENRGVVCGMCYKKSKDLRKISPHILAQLQQFVESQYSLEDPRFQTVLCSVCVKILSVYNKNPDNPEGGRKLVIPCYVNLTPPQMHNTRSSDTAPCPCTMCDIARQHIPPRKDGVKVPMSEHHWSILFPDHPYPVSKVGTFYVNKSRAPYIVCFCVSIFVCLYFTTNMQISC